MPRPMKWRKVCCLPVSNKFGPLDLNVDEENFVRMTVDEYEAIRLIDLEGFTQEECAKQMNVARTTVQGIYAEARKKIARSLVNGKVLLIEGGEYRLCEGFGNRCGRGCRRHRHGWRFAGSDSQPTVSQAIKELEEHSGGLLFERLSKKLYITAKGQKLLSYARNVVKQFDDMEEAMGRGQWNKRAV